MPRTTPIGPTTPVPPIQDTPDPVMEKVSNGDLAGGADEAVIDIENTYGVNTTPVSPEPIVDVAPPPKSERDRLADAKVNAEEKLLDALERGDIAQVEQMDKVIKRIDARLSSLVDTEVAPESLPIPRSEPTSEVSEPILEETLVETPVTTPVGDTETQIPVDTATTESSIEKSTMTGMGGLTPIEELQTRQLEQKAEASRLEAEAKRLEKEAEDLAKEASTPTADSTTVETMAAHSASVSRLQEAAVAKETAEALNEEVEVTKELIETEKKLETADKELSKKVVLPGTTILPSTKVREKAEDESAKAIEELEKAELELAQAQEEGKDPSIVTNFSKMVEKQKEIVTQKEEFLQAAKIEESNIISDEVKSYEDEIKELKAELDEARKEGMSQEILSGLNKEIDDTEEAFDEFKFSLPVGHALKRYREAEEAKVVTPEETPETASPLPAGTPTSSPADPYAETFEEDYDVSVGSLLSEEAVEGDPELKKYKLEGELEEIKGDISAGIEILDSLDPDSDSNGSAEMIDLLSKIQTRAESKAREIEEQEKVIRDQEAAEAAEPEPEPVRESLPVYTPSTDPALTQDQRRIGRQIENYESQIASMTEARDNLVASGAPDEVVSRYNEDIEDYEKGLVTLRRDFDDSSVVPKTETQTKASDVLSSTESKLEGLIAARDKLQEEGAPSSVIARRNDEINSLEKEVETLQSRYNEATAQAEAETQAVRGKLPVGHELKEQERQVLASAKEAEEAAIAATEAKEAVLGARADETVSDEAVKQLASGYANLKRISKEKADNLAADQKALEDELKAREEVEVPESDDEPEAPAPEPVKAKTFEELLPTNLKKVYDEKAAMESMTPAEKSRVNNFPTELAKRNKIVGYHERMINNILTDLDGATREDVQRAMNDLEIPLSSYDDSNTPKKIKKQIKKNQDSDYIVGANAVKAAVKAARDASKPPVADKGRLARDNFQAFATDITATPDEVELVLSEANVVEGDVLTNTTKLRERLREVVNERLGVTQPAKPGNIFKTDALKTFNRIADDLKITDRVG